MGLVELLSPPPLRTAKMRRIPSGVQLDTPERNIRLRLPDNCTALQFLQKVYMHPRMPMETRIECAIAAMPYQTPKLLAVVTNSSNPGEQVLRIVGGLPRLPGTAHHFPRRSASSASVRHPAQDRAREGDWQLYCSAHPAASLTPVFRRMLSPKRQLTSASPAVCRGCRARSTVFPGGPQAADRRRHGNRPRVVGLHLGDQLRDMASRLT
jgi:hypothetical protein